MSPQRPSKAMKNDSKHSQSVPRPTIRRHENIQPNSFVSNMMNDDMVIFGNWEKPPLWKLRNELVEQGITREESISGFTFMCKSQILAFFQSSKTP